LVSEALSESQRAPRLPIWGTSKDAYRHLWQHRWPYLGQLLLWALILLMAQTLAGVVVTAGIFRALDLPLRIDLVRAPYMVATVLCLIAGGGAIFLSCASALMSQQAPRLSDAVRLRHIGPFWRTMILYWLTVHLLPTVAVYGANTYKLTHRDYLSWLSYYPLYSGYWAWALLTAPIVVLALPISACEEHASPLREAWIRSRGNRLRILATSFLCALPAIVISQARRYVEPSIWEALGANGWWPGTLWLFRFLSGLVACSLSVLLILLFSAAVTSAYLRLSPRLDQVARVFD
jgi:hypothetical protein